jgi:hypothetical protein
MDLHYISFILILIFILQIYIAYKVFNLSRKIKIEKYDNGCRPGQLKNFGICMNPQSFDLKF